MNSYFKNNRDKETIVFLTPVVFPLILPKKLQLKLDYFATMVFFLKPINKEFEIAVFYPFKKQSLH
jgi:hypothetical protein